MRLNDIQMIELLPFFMQGGEAEIALCAFVDKYIKNIADNIDKLSIWTSIDKMSNSELDDLAYELNIQWYLDTDDIDIKRNVIKNAQKINDKLGTVWAVEQALQIYFENATLKEWFEYGGEPGTFKIYTTNAELLTVKLPQFLQVLNHVKRVSAHFDGFEVILVFRITEYAGFTTKDLAHDRMVVTP